MRPQTQEHILRHVFSHRAVAEYAPGEGNDPSEMALDQLTTGRLIPSPNPQHQRLIRFINHDFRAVRAPKEI